VETAKKQSGKKRGKVSKVVRDLTTIAPTRPIVRRGPFSVACGAGTKKNFIGKGKKVGGRRVAERPPTHVGRIYPGGNFSLMKRSEPRTKKSAERENKGKNREETGRRIIDQKN